MNPRLTVCLGAGLFLAQVANADSSTGGTAGVR